MTVKAKNRLAAERSPYLLQHAENPVDWYPWCEEALLRAKREQKVIFLSIGYSSCHWCHVMEREVFENEEAAALLNEHFINIKVDREERPDLDHLYMEACVALTGAGGWPLSIFLTPQGHPFFAGSYFPLNAFLGRFGKVVRLWQERREEVEKASQAVLEALRQSAKGGGYWEQNLPEQAFSALQMRFDAQNGGFGAAPKFPSPQMLQFLYRYSLCRQDQRGREMVEKTLDQMALGGLYDHVGGGFFRYSTDEKFLIPHFEKMLYDNAMLLLVYAETGRLQTAKGLYEFCVQTFGSPEGAFYTALDADSEGKEGRYYLFSYDEAAALLGNRSAEFCQWYDITSGGNFEGLSHLNLLAHGPLDETQRAAAAPLLAKLNAARAKRTPPLLDDKIILSSNSLMLAALSVYSRAAGQGQALDRAVRLAEFLCRNMCRQGRYYASYRGTLGPHPATSEDYAYLSYGLLKLYQATLDDRWLSECRRVLQGLTELFADSDGLFFMSGRDVSDVPVRTKDTYDGALPSGNSIAAEVFYSMALITGEKQYAQAFEKILTAMGPAAKLHPMSYTALLSAALLREKGLRVEIAPALFEELRGVYPLAVFARQEKAPADQQKTPACRPRQPAASSDLSKDAPQAKICTPDRCTAPISDPAQLQHRLKSYERTGRL